MIETASWRWRIADDVDCVHELMEDSDRRGATRDAPRPIRNRGRTQALIDAGVTHILEIDKVAAATFSLTKRPPFDDINVPFTPAGNVLYLQRLAVVTPALQQHGAMPGLSALRHAIEVATEQGTDALRSEANPDLRAVYEMLAAVGFRAVATLRKPGKPSKAYLEYYL